MHNKEKEKMENPETIESLENQEVEKTSSSAQGKNSEEKGSKESIDEQYIRLCATFENYKKRVQKEQLRWMKQANKQLLLSLLPVLDDLELALAQEQGHESVQKAFEGVQLIYKKLQQLLKDQGLQEIEVVVGGPFNADFHEALTTLPTEEEKEKGTIAQVVNKGYKQEEHVFRFAKVIVYA